MEQYAPDPEKSKMLEEYHHSILRKFILLGVLIIAIVLVIGFLSLNVYPGMSLGETYDIIWKHLTGHTYTYQENIELYWKDYIIWHDAMPTVFAAILTGAGLACCGTLMQALMSNPLADPYSTGISSGACLGAMASILMGITVANFTGTSGTVVNAFLGAMIPAAIIIMISERIHLTPATLILIGTALSMFFGSFVSVMMTFASDTDLQLAYKWQVGSFSRVDWNAVYIMLPITVIGSALVMLLSRKLNIMALGDNSAKSLGIDVKQFRTLCLTLMALMTASLVAYVGIIAFVGLVCPHIVRLLTGSDNRFVIPTSMCLGAFLMLISNYLAEVVFSGIQIGVVINAIGAPIFFIMLVMARTSGKGAVY